ncbi:MerR family transcriptional regulator [Fodinicola acaciae]|uniref:MerR family transcriptional regulator n=1 Tax=Fodinicola acaciae TaxID=2681555 RepID=UPI0016522648|nr:MerR family transcriptional regulator [Fodinicola acaciae]
MLTTGEFSQLSGLSNKALRIYDEQGLLRPAEVDEWSRYRRYAAGQLDAAVRLKAARAAGISLADADQVLRGEVSIVATQRERLAAERARQDAALEALELMMKHDAGWDIVERTVSAQPWVAVVLPVDADTDQANDAFAALWKALSAAENAPIGPFWSSMRTSANGDRVELLCCWPVPRALPPDWSIPQWTVTVGETPAGPEPAVRWRHDDPMPVVDGATHPPVIALLAEAERRGVDLDLSRLRQIGVIEDGQAVGMEVSIPLANNR